MGNFDASFKLLLEGASFVRAWDCFKILGETIASSVAADEVFLGGDFDDRIASEFFRSWFSVSFYPLVPEIQLTTLDIGERDRTVQYLQLLVKHLATS